jgi:hypothetical protein
MVKAVGSEKYAQAVDDSIVTSPFFQTAQDAGLYFAPRGQGSKIALNQKEEAFMSKLASKLPWVSASERAYTTFLNKLRMEVFETIAKEWGDVPAQNYQSLANFINAGTGRGRLGPLQSAGPVLNALFFSPRFFTSRIENVTNLADPVIRKQVANALWKFYGTGAAAMGLLAAAGADVELDPRSSDFGKVRFGNTRYDFWAGYQQIARYLAQLATGQRKTVTGANAGKVREVERYTPLISFDEPNVVGDFIRSKLAPTPGAVTNVQAGTDPTGATATPAGQAIDQLVPIFVNEIYQAALDEGIPGVLANVPAVFGVGVQTFGEAKGIGETIGQGLFGEPKRKGTSSSSRPTTPTRTQPRAPVGAGSGGSLRERLGR